MTQSREQKLKELGAHFMNSLGKEGYTLEETHNLLVSLLDSIEDTLTDEELKKIDTILEIAKHAIGENPQEN